MVGINSAMWPTNVAAISQYLPRFVLMPLPEGVGHFPQVEVPAAFNKQLEQAVTLLSGASAEVSVPRGHAPVLDGVLSPAEWNEARRIPLHDGGEILLQVADGNLYVGLRRAKLAVGNICLDRGDEVAVLHSSAALGTAVYVRAGTSWKLQRSFDWKCRLEPNVGPDALQAQRKTFLGKEHWLASTATMGTPGEMEYQIAMPTSSLRLAISSIQVADKAIASWPLALGDDCRNPDLLGGDHIEATRFSPLEWITVHAGP
jgi:hypothetical protein